MTSYLIIFKLIEKLKRVQITSGIFFYFAVNKIDEGSKTTTTLSKNIEQFFKPASVQQFSLFLKVPICN